MSIRNSRKRTANALLDTRMQTIENTEEKEKIPLIEKDPDDEFSATTDMFTGFTTNVYMETIRNQIWHTYYGRTGVFIFQEMLDTIISALKFMLGLAAYGYLKEELENLTDLALYSHAYNLLIVFGLTIVFLIAKRAITPFVNLNMGGDYHNLYDHQEKLLAMQRKMLESHQKMLQNTIVMANTVQSAAAAAAVSAPSS